MGAPAAPAAAQLTEPFPPVFDLDTLRAAAGGDGSLGFVLHGYEIDDLAGWSVSSAGDINGDGLDDLIVGAPGQYYARHYYGPYHLAGRAYILFGRDSAGAGFAPELDLYALDGTHGFRFEGPALATPQTGYAVASLGDVNGDGIDDIIMGAPKSGHCYIVFGRTAAGGGFPRPVTPEDLHGEGGVTLTGGRGSATGLSVSSAGDINGDGVADMIVGAPCEAAPSVRSGVCSIVFGRDRLSPLPGVIDLRALAPPSGLRFGGLGPDHMAGWSVARAGDVNGDGLADVIIGAPGASSGEIGSGSSYVVFGRTDGAFPASLADLDGANGFRIDGDGEYAQSGSAVAGAGDVNGDGAGDLLVAARGQLRESRVYIVFGRDGAAGGFDPVLELSAIDGETGLRIDGIPGEAISVAAAGDVNGDGAGDVIIGAPYGAAGAGQSFVIFGRAQPPFPPSIHVSELDGVIGFRIDGGSGGSGQGASGAGDINGDGADDLVIGAPHAFKLRPGEAFVLFGRQADGGCFADCDGSGGLDVFDFLCFQNLFAAGDPRADCDRSGVLDLLDFLCFQNAFAAGCR